MPLISVIIPVYKVEPYLCRCLDSVLIQSFSDFELILVDDGSPDNSGVICDEYAKKDNRIQVFHQTNQGQAIARNKALDWIFANSDCEYISFVDSDDWIHPKYLELLYYALQKYNTSISQCKHVTTDAWEAYKDISEVKTKCVSSEEEYTNWYSAFFWGKMFRKKCFLSFRFPEGKIFEDVLIWYKILFQFEKVAIVNEELYFYFQRSDNTTNSSWTPSKLTQVEAWEDQLEFACKYGSKPVLKTVLRRFCWVYKHQCEEILISNRITKKEKKEYKSRLLKRLRFVLLQYRRELREVGIYKYYCTWAFLKMGCFYQKIKRILRKIRRLLNE